MFRLHQSNEQWYIWGLELTNKPFSWRFLGLYYHPNSVLINHLRFHPMFHQHLRNKHILPLLPLRVLDVSYFPELRYFYLSFILISFGIYDYLFANFYTGSRIRKSRRISAWHHLAIYLSSRNWAESMSWPKHRHF